MNETEPSVKNEQYIFRFISRYNHEAYGYITCYIIYSLNWILILKTCFFYFSKQQMGSFI